MNYPVTGCAILLTLAAAFPTRADQVTLSPSKDNTIFSDAPGTLSNALGSFVFAGNAGASALGATRRALLRFDLSSIPAGSTVSAATLTLRLSKAPFGGGTRSFSLFRLDADWGETTSIAGGNEGTGAPAGDGDATWFQPFFGTVSWATPGGDHAAVASATTGVGEDLVDYTWGSTPAMVSDIQAWRASPAANFGWILIGDESVQTTARRFNSRENLDQGSRPRLTVTFTPPAVCYPNCDSSTAAPALNVGDFTCFLQKYAAGEVYANCDGSTAAPALNVGDFTCFLQKYAAGCP